MRDNCVTGVSAVSDASSRVQQQPALNCFRLGRVTLVAVFNQHGADAALEELDTVSVCLGQCSRHHASHADYENDVSQHTDPR